MKSTSPRGVGAWGGGMFPALSFPDYRLFFAGRFLSGTGIWFQRVAQDWLVVQLTGSSSSLGITIAFQFVPTLVFGLSAGVIADRYPRRYVLIVTQLAFAAVALTLAVLVLTGRIQFWQVLALAFILGTATAIENPVRQAFLSDLVPGEALHNAISLDSAAFQTARLIGPALAGLTMDLIGVGWSFLAASIGCAGLSLSVTRLREISVGPTERVRELGAVRAGLLYVLSRPDLMWLIVLVGFIGTFAANYVLVVSAYATQVFHSGANIFGLMHTMLGVGALIGALITARIGASSLRLVIASAASLCVAQGVLGTMHAQAPFIIGLIPVGVGNIVVLAAAASFLQNAAAPEYRGRVMALYSLVLVGGIPLGSPVIGHIIDVGGPEAGFQTGNAIALAGTAFVTTAMLVSRRRTRIAVGS